MSNGETTTEGAVSEWGDLMLRLHQVTRKDRGISVINLQIVTEFGKPKYWCILDNKEIEPADMARSFMASLGNFDT